MKHFFHVVAEGFDRVCEPEVQNNVGPVPG